MTFVLAANNGLTQGLLSSCLLLWKHSGPKSYLVPSARRLMADSEQIQTTTVIPSDAFGAKPPALVISSPIALLGCLVFAKLEAASTPGCAVKAMNGNDSESHGAVKNS